MKGKSKSFTRRPLWTYNKKNLNISDLASEILQKSKFLLCFIYIHVI